MSSAPVRIRLARAAELPALQRIEREAGARFRGMGLLDHLLGHSLSLPDLSLHQRAGRVWVAVDGNERPLGFAVANVLEASAHLEELDVLPEAGRQGIGTRLVEAVCRWAEAEGFAALTLSTFRDVPWNAPFYARLGFQPVDPADLSPDLRRMRAREQRLGIALGGRVVMRRLLRPAADRSPAHLVLYDGECGVCTRMVRWLLAADRRGALHFAPLQGPTAAALRRRWPALPTDLDSIVYVDRSNGGEAVYWRSEAVFRLCRVVGGAWRALALLAWLPRRATDTAYDAFARRRHWFGRRTDQCAPLPAAARARFLP